MAQGVQRFNKSHPCPVCKGYPELPQGKGIRCTGFPSGDYVYCSRPEVAGEAPEDTKTQPSTYRHWFGPGVCRCGVNHTGREAAQNGREAAKAPTGAPSPARSTSGGQSRPPDDENITRTQPPTYEYEYQDPATGKVLAVHGRWQWPSHSRAKGYDKTFRWRMPNKPWAPGGGGYALGGVKSGELPPFGAVEMIVQAADTPVFVVEGEECVKRMRAEGYMAVAWNSGSQVEFPDHWLDLFKRRLVYICPDNDGDGNKHANAFYQALNGRPRFAAFLRPAVPLHGDVVDYLDAGGTIPDLLKGVLTGPAVDVLDRRRLVVRLPQAEGVIEFDFANLGPDRGTIKGNLTVKVPRFADQWEAEVAVGSASGRAGILTQLRGLYGKDLAWDSLVNQAFSKARHAWDQHDWSVGAGDLPDYQEAQFVVEELLVDGITNWFGLGSSLKTYLMEAVCMAMMLQEEQFLGLKLHRPVPVLFLDWESESQKPKESRFRCSRILTGMGCDPSILPDLPIRWMKPLGPLTAVLRQIERSANQMGAGFVVVNGVQRATRDLIRDDHVNDFFDALSELGLPVGMIGHLSKSEEERQAAEGDRFRPGGNVMFENIPRRCIHFKRSANNDTDVIDLRLKVTKTNGRTPRDIGIQFEFDGRDGGVELSRKGIDRMDHVQDERSAKVRVEELLRRTGQDMSVMDLATELGLRNTTVARECRRLQTEGKAMLSGGGRGKAGSTWRSA